MTHRADQSAPSPGDTDNSLLDLLPESLQEIAELAGLESAMQMSLKMGGRRYMIPEKARGSRLADMVGEEAAEQICADMSGLTIEVPLARRALAHWMAAQGASRSAIRQLLRVSEGSLRRWGLKTLRRVATEVSLPVELVLCSDNCVTYGEAGISLSSYQARLLAAIVARHGQVATRDYLMTSLYWDRASEEPLPKVIDVFLCKLRGQLRKICPVEVILTVWGEGWRLNTQQVHFHLPDYALVLTLPPEQGRRLENLALASDCSVQALLQIMIGEALPSREKQVWAA